MLLRPAAGAFAMMLAAAVPAAGQPVELPLMPAQDEAAPAPNVDDYTPAQIMALVAPVALYPDPLLADILAASTYPVQVVEAQRFISAPGHAGLDAAAMTRQAAAHGWDPSVRALLAFPQVLGDMDRRLEWFEHLGRIFLAQPGAVLAAVQQLRQEAEQAGVLQNGPDASVVNDGGNVLINPPSQNEIYVPSYDPACVYAAGPCGGVSALAWGSGLFLPDGYWQWGGLDWNRRQLRFGQGEWRRDPAGPLPGQGRDFGDVWHHGLKAVPGYFPLVPFAYAPPAGERVPVTMAQPAHFATPTAAFAPRAPFHAPPPASFYGPGQGIPPHVVARVAHATAGHR